MLLAGKLLSSSEVEIRSDNDLELGCINTADATRVDGELVCTWTCKVSFPCNNLTHFTLSFFSFSSCLLKIRFTHHFKTSMGEINPKAT